jgi:hypothetical protein
MTWFKVDDKLWGHQKWIAASPGARALWVTAGSWCADHLTDGVVPRHMLATFGARAGDSRKLLEIGLWEEVDGGFRFRDWDEYQPSREQVEADRKAARQRQQAARDRAREARSSRRDDAVTSRVTSGDVTALSRLPDPTRPDHIEETSSLQGAAPRPKPRATRLPEDWQPTREMVEQARIRFPRLDLRTETEKFRNYWHAKSRDATKVDWAKTWTNWLISANERTPNGKVRAISRGYA